MSDATQTLHALFARHHEYRREISPEFATYEGDHRFNDRLSDLSAASEAQQLKDLQAFRAELSAIPRDGLSHADQLNHDMFALLLDESIELHAFKTWQAPINQMTGYHLSLPQLIDIQPLKSAEGYPDYLARLRAFPAQVADVIANLQQGLAEKRVPPRHIMEQVLPQLESLMAGPAEDSVFFLPLKNNPDFDAATRNRLGDELAATIDEAVKPGYQQLYDFVRESYLPGCRETLGIWDLPDGEALYEFCIKSYTAPGLSAEAIHQLGLKEVARIHQQKTALKDQLGFDDSVEAFNHYLRTDPSFAFGSAEELRASYEAVMEEAYAKTPALFHRMPKAPCILKEVEEYKAKSSPQAYYMPAPEDGSRPGLYYINTYDLPSRPKYAVTALTLHEAIPGHHLQIALAQELDNLPYFRRRLHVTAYLEGWGLYAEYLGHQMDMYRDPYQHYGALAFEMWRACRLVVDTGIHAMRWTRQQAIDFMKKHMANSEHDIAAEVDRYTIMPGQALSYKIGEIKIKQLRARAEKTLGERFDLRDFHEVVLRNGAIPLAVLEAEVDRWLAEA
ncbi:MAG: DUF885 domain-containing protein [Candidatus Sericytochromatia bacterium]